MTTRTLRGALACALLASTCLAAPAFAQTSAEMPPVYAYVDQNGVDVVSGKLSIVLASASIGPGGPGSLFYNWSTSAGAKAITEGSVSGSGNEYLVSIGGSSEKFTLHGPFGFGGFTNAQGRPSTLSYDSGTQRFTYTGADGMVAVYRRTGDLSSTSYVSASLASLTYPAGEKLSFVQNASGGTSIWSNLGYQMRFEAAGPNQQRIVLFNMAQESCAPEAASCTLTGSWPSLTIEGNYKATDSLGRVTRIDHPTPDRFVVTYPSGRQVTYTYVFVGDVQKITSVNDGSGTWTYDYGGDTYVGINTITAPNGVSTRTVYWQKTTGQITHDTLNQQSQDNRATAYSMDASQRITEITTPDGMKQKFKYDARGNLKEKRIVSSTGSPADIVTSADYPESCSNPKTCNKPSFVIDARGNRTDFAYDPTHGGLTSITAPAAPNGVQPQVRNSYTALSATYRDGSGNLVQGSPVYRLTGSSQCANQSSCAGEPDEVKTTIAYGTNEALQPTSTTSGSGDGTLAATTAISYVPTGDVKTVNQPLPGAEDTVRNYYDSARQLTGTIGPDPDGSEPLLRRAIRFTYNGEGQIVKREAGTAADDGDGGMLTFQPLEQQVTEYNAQGRKAKESFVAGGATHAVTQYSYTPEGLLDCAAQRMDPGAFGSLPGACSQSGGGNDRIAKNVYNSFLERTKVTTGFGTTAALDEVTTSYDRMSRPLAVTDAENNKTSYEYDGFGRLSRTLYPSPSKGSGTSNPNDYEQVGYDARSNVTSSLNRAGEWIYSSYDALGRLAFRDLPGTEPDRSYGYDLLGRMTSASVSGNALRFGYDALGRKRTESGPHGTVSSSYDLAGRRTTLQHPDGFAVSHKYLVTGEMTQILQPGDPENPFGSSTVLVSFGYDNLGRRSSLSRLNGTTTRYSYDPAARLSQLVQDVAGTSNDLTLGFGYNAADQITSNTRSNDAYAFTGHELGTSPENPNGLNQLVSRNGAGVSHDAKGNVTYDPTTGSSFGYSSENLLTRVSIGSWSGGLTYDPLMRLYQAGSTKMGYDGQERIAEYDGAGTQTARFVHGPGLDEPLIEYGGSGLTTRKFLHADERGSIVAGSDDAGNVTAVTKYDEYGRAQNQLSRFGYTGQPIETMTDLIYSRARMYNPRFGRFMQPDPIGYDDGMNMYVRTKGDPVNRRDPTGLCENGTNLFHNRMVFDRSGVLKSNTVTPLGFFCFDIPKLGGFSATDDAEQAPLVHQAARRYTGRSFCPNPTVGVANRFNPFGRINSGKVGGFETALTDVDRIAAANGLTPLGDVVVNAFSVGVMTQFLIPSPIGGGWSVGKNYWSGDTTFSNNGLGFRYNAESGKINIDIPGGFHLPNGGTVAQNETCHYRR